MLSRLLAAHGWRYVGLVISVYGINQGAGEGLAFFAQQYWMTDGLEVSNSSNNIGLGLSPSRFAEVDAFTSIPWQIKSLYGIASDVMPIFSLHKIPYMFLSSTCGMVAFLMLWQSNFALTVFGSALLLFLANFSIATPDVMIDASIAQKSSLDPTLASDLQALCWISFGVFKIFALLVVPKLMAAKGTRFVFGVASLTALAVMIPTWFNWMGEVARPASNHHPQDENNKSSCLHRLRAFAAHADSGPFLRLSLLLTMLSLCMGFVSMSVTSHRFISVFAMCVITPLLGSLVFYFERQVDVRLAKFSLYIFLSGAIQPSAPVLFYWMRADEINCAQHLPCFSPDFISSISIVGYVMFVLGTLFYNKYLTRVSYRKIYLYTQLSMFLLNMIDLVWITRLNLRWGISDELFVLGDEVISPMIARWNTMPMLILSSVLCPPHVEATFFAMTMGLSNFGGSLGEYFGVGLMDYFGVTTHKYDSLVDFVLVRSLFRLLPLVLIPFLLPEGSPDEPPSSRTERREGEEEEEGAPLKAQTYAAIEMPKLGI